MLQKLGKFDVPKLMFAVFSLVNFGCWPHVSGAAEHHTEVSACVMKLKHNLFMFSRDLLGFLVKQDPWARREFRFVPSTLLTLFITCVQFVSRKSS